MYVDIVDNKGPILYLINALFMKLGNQTGIIILEFIILFISLLYLWKSIKLINNNNKYQRIILLLLIGSFLTRLFCCKFSQILGKISMSIFFLHTIEPLTSIPKYFSNYNAIKFNNLILLLKVILIENIFLFCK